MQEIFEIASQISTPLGLGGVFATLLFFIFRQILKKDIFPLLTRSASAEVIKVIVDRLFVLAMIAMVLGFAGYILPKSHKPFVESVHTEPNSKTLNKLPNTERSSISTKTIGVSGKAENVVQNSGDNSFINTGNIKAIIKIDDPNSKQIELINLIALFTIPSYESYNVLGWDVASNKYSPIEWKFDGIREAPEWQKEKGFYYREGEVVITVNGKVTHHALKREGLEPVAWQVILHGARAGVMGVTIDTNIISHEMEQIFYGSKSLLEISKKIKCEPESAMDGLEVFEITLPGKKPVWLEYSWSCGSAGCSSTFYILYSKQEALARECFD